ncbi:hypothetical protein [Asticcacaulis excentricus]|uniref:Uncharacterized protein n=1 Tax=Asticcacaulis excentricus (strain ATCC 15261 / DSM 4724 / KCTC 12464 / NCIMB 9791 / VKM B-1370 / CB 48) TaxID=573065 RepID=E8RSR6_ASTEC|nr:hypothetical protein [Asticcacaulis excentricus]ADU14537.1 hypothetical protein Astex_2900 [Asticcacaulis excentricus CB 48]
MPHAPAINDNLPPLEQARLLLDKRVERTPSIFKALMASAAFAVSGLWLAASMLVGPVMSHNKAEPTPVVSKAVDSGTEGGFQLSASPSDLK